MLRAVYTLAAVVAADAFLIAPSTLNGRSPSDGSKACLRRPGLALAMTAAKTADRLSTDDDFLPDNTVRQRKDRY